MSEKLKKAYEAYKDTFSEDFPTVPLAETREDTEIIEMIEECIEAGKEKGITFPEREPVIRTNYIR